MQSDLKIRGEIAIKTAQASRCVNDSDFMRECWYEAFRSNSTIPNYLRLFVDEEAITKYKDFAEKRIEKLHIYDRYCNQDASETAKNNVTEIEHKFLCFFAGHFDKVKNWCMEQKSPLGWSGSFISYGLDLILLYLYADNNLRKASKKIVAQVSNTMRFNESKNLVFMKENAVFETEVSMQKEQEIFWHIFRLWKTNYSIAKLGF